MKFANFVLGFCTVGIIMILMAGFASAVSEYDTWDGWTQLGTVAQTHRYGGALFSNVTATEGVLAAVSVSKHPADQSDICGLYDPTTTTYLINESFSGDMCTIEYDVPYNTKYYVFGMKTGDASRDLSYGSTMYWPQNSSNQTFWINSRVIYNGAAWSEDNATNPVLIYKINVTIRLAETQFALSASNYYNGSTLTHFNATFYNGTVSQFINTTNGSIYWPRNQIVNITVGKPGYINRSFYGINTSTNFEAELYQAIAYVYAVQNYTNNTITNFNLTVGTQFNTSNGGYTTHYLNADTYSYTGQAEDHNYNSTGSFTLSEEEVLNTTIGFIPFAANITAKEIFSNDTINNFTIQVLSDYYDYNYSTTVGWLLVYGVNGTYNLTILTDDYADQSVMYNLTADGQNYTFYLYTTNSIYFSFYDEVSLDLIDFQEVSIDIISEAESGNFSTSNGTLYVDLLSPSIYTIRSSSNGYDTRYYEYTLLDNSNIVIDIYLVNTSNANYDQISVQILNQGRTGQEDVTVKLLRYDLTDNTYTIREVQITNFDGYVYPDVIKNEEYYRLIFEYAGEVVGMTDKFVITEDSYTFQIVIGSDVGEYLFGMASVTAVVDYIEASGWFKYTYSDPTNQVTMACMELYRTNILNDSVLINSTCLNGTSGIMYLPVEEINETSYTAYGFVYLGDVERFADSDSVSFSGVPDMGNIGIFICFLLTAVLITAYVFSGKHVLIMIVPIPTVLFSAFSWIPVDFQYAVGIEIAAIILSLLIMKGSS